MTPSGNNKSISSGAIIQKYGFLAGAVAISCTLIQLAIDKSLVSSPWGFLVFAGVLATGVAGALHYRAANGGLLAFGQSVAITMGIYAIGIVLSVLFDQVLTYFGYIPAADATGIAILKLVQTFFANVLFLAILGLFLNVILSIFIRKESSSK